MRPGEYDVPDEWDVTVEPADQLPTAPYRPLSGPRETRQAAPETLELVEDTLERLEALIASMREQLRRSREQEAKP